MSGCYNEESGGGGGGGFPPGGVESSSSIVTDHGILRADELLSGGSARQHPLLKDLGENEERILLWLLKNNHSPQGINAELIKHLARDHRLSESSGVGSAIENLSSLGECPDEFTSGIILPGGVN